MKTPKSAIVLSIIAVVGYCIVARAYKAIASDAPPPQVYQDAKVYKAATNAQIKDAAAAAPLHKDWNDKQGVKDSSTKDMAKYCWSYDLDKDSYSKIPNCTPSFL